MSTRTATSHSIGKLKKQTAPSELLQMGQFYLIPLQGLGVSYFTSSNVICTDIQQYTSICCKYDTIKKAIKNK